MIVLRLYEQSPGNGLVAGSCQIHGYHGTDAGWFPIDSFGFGFSPKAPEQPEKTKPTGGGGGTTKPTTPVPTAGKSPDAKTEGEKDFTRISVAKQVDTGTVQLMFLAMRDRKKTKGAESKIQSDIHVLSSVTVNGKRHIYPSLMIHLAGVLVKEWNMQADEDGRPTESLELWYDRAAMYYVATADGKEFMSYGPKGWDQTKNDTYSWEDGEWKKFLKDLPVKKGLGG